MVLIFLVLLSDSYLSIHSILPTNKPLMYLLVAIKDLLKLLLQLQKHVTEAHSYSKGRLDKPRDKIGHDAFPPLPLRYEKQN